MLNIRLENDERTIIGIICLGFLSSFFSDDDLLHYAIRFVGEVQPFGDSRGRA